MFQKKTITVIILAAVSFTWLCAFSPVRFLVESPAPPLVKSDPSSVTAPVGEAAPVISGTQRQGQTLSSTTGTWAGDPTAYSYQWKRGGISIDSATNNTYVLTSSDSGAVITCDVTATNSVGAATQSSNALTMSSYLDFVIASVSTDLDATVAASYPGSGQTWANLIAAPADGVAQTAYDMYLGANSSATTDDPTFTGSAGSKTAYFAMDGGDHFSLKSGANTTFLKSLHKKPGGQDWWSAITIKSINFTAVNAHFSTQSSSTTAGLRVVFGISEGLTHVQRGDSTATTANSTIATGTNNETVAIVSHSHSTNTTRFWISRSGATPIAESVAQTYNSTTADASSVFAISIYAGGFNLQNGVRIYGFAMGNEFLDNTKAADIISSLETRHGRDYTPP